MARLRLLPTLLLLVACGGSAAEADEAPAPDLLAETLDALPRAYAVDYIVSKVHPQRGDTARNAGTLLVGVDPRYDYALADTQGYTVVVHEDTLWRQLGEQPPVREVGRRFGDFRDRYLPLHQTPLRLREVGDWERLGLRSADGHVVYAGTFPREGFPLPQGRAVRVELDEGARRIRSVTTELQTPGGRGAEVRWDYRNWRTDLAADPEAAARVAALLP